MRRPPPLEQCLKSVSGAAAFDHRLNRLAERVVHPVEPSCDQFWLFRHSRGQGNGNLAADESDQGEQGVEAAEAAGAVRDRRTVEFIASRRVLERPSRGSQYTSILMGKTLRELDVVSSIARLRRSHPCIEEVLRSRRGGLHGLAERGGRLGLADELPAPARLERIDLGRELDGLRLLHAGLLRREAALELGLQAGCTRTFLHNVEVRVRPNKGVDDSAGFEDREDRY